MVFGQGCDDDGDAVAVAEGFLHGDAVVVVVVEDGDEDGGGGDGGAAVWRPAGEESTFQIDTVLVGGKWCLC